MVERWGDKLVQRAVEGIEGVGITPQDVMGRTILMVNTTTSEDDWRTDTTA